MLRTHFPDSSNITLNGSANDAPSFYAPSTAGTSGQVLESTGGIPTWLGVDTSPTDSSTNLITSGAVKQSLSSHTSDTTVHVTAEERTAWNNKAPRPTQTAVTLSAASWVGTSAPYTYTISSVTCTATQIVSVYGAMGLTTEQVKAMAKSMITGSSQAVNSIVLEAQSLPTIDLPVIVEVGGEPA